MAQRCEAQITFTRSYSNGDVQANFNCNSCDMWSVFFPKFTPKRRMEITEKDRSNFAKQCPKFKSGVTEIPPENINSKIEGWYPQVLLDLRAKELRGDS